MADIPDIPAVFNPEAVGDPDQTPMVRIPGPILAMLKRSACPECGWINYSHVPGCSRAGAKTRPQHDFRPVAGHPDDDECTHRSDGTDETYCGLTRAEHGVGDPR